MKFFFATALLIASLHGAAAANDAADAKALLDKVITAYGGEEALGKIVAIEFKGKGTLFNAEEKLVSKLELYVEGDDKMRLVSTNIVMINGNKGWVKETGKDAEELTDEELAAQREVQFVNYVAKFVPLKGKDFQISLVDEIEINDRKAVGLLVKHDKHKPLKLFFDKESHLLIKCLTEIKDPATGIASAVETVYSDYATVQGIKRARKIETYLDGAEIAEREGDMKIYDKPLDKKLFAKP